jgi:hypothetical protein
VAKYFYDEVSRKLEGQNGEVPTRIAQIKIWETDTSIAVYRPS